MHAASFWISARQYGLLILDHPLLVTATSSDHMHAIIGANSAGSNNINYSKYIYIVVVAIYRLRNKYSNNRIPFPLCSPYHSNWLASVYYIDTVCGVFFTQKKKQEKETSEN